MSVYDPLQPRMSSERRQEILSYNIRAYAVDGYILESRGEYDAIIYRQSRVNHVLHAVLTILTCIWGLVWIIVVACAKKPERHMIWVDESGESGIRRISS